MNEDNFWIIPDNIKQKLAEISVDFKLDMGITEGDNRESNRVNKFMGEVIMVYSEALQQLEKESKNSH